MPGYHELEGLSWLDAFLNSAMMLGGMGPVDALKTDTGKLFAGCYVPFPVWFSSWSPIWDDKA